MRRLVFALALAFLAQLTVAQAQGSIEDVLREAGGFGIFRTAIGAAGVDLSDESGPFTVFAIPDRLLLELEGSELVSFLSVEGIASLIIVGEFTAESLRRMLTGEEDQISLETIGGQELDLSLSEAKDIIVNGSARVEGESIAAANGVVLTISRILDRQVGAADGVDSDGLIGGVDIVTRDVLDEDLDEELEFDEDLDDEGLLDDDDDLIRDDDGFEDDEIIDDDD